MPGGLLGGGMLKTLCRRACVTPLTGSGVSPPGGHWDTPGHAVLSEVPIGNSAASGAQQPSVPVLGQPIPSHPSRPPYSKHYSLLPALPQARHCMPRMLTDTHSTARNVVNLQC